MKTKLQFSPKTLRLCFAKLDAISKHEQFMENRFHAFSEIFYHKHFESVIFKVRQNKLVFTCEN